MGLERHEEDFAQTFAVWGIGAGPYLQIPLLGPSSVRDAIGRVLDATLNPLAYVEEASARDKLIALMVIDLRAQFLGVDDALNEALDPYVFLRESYVQRRTYVIYDGDPPLADDEEWLDEDEDWEVAPPE